MKTKILITIRGGIITDIMSNRKDVQIVIVDHDKTDAGENPVSEVMGPDYFVMEKERGEKMYERFNDNEPGVQEIREELKRMKF